jgi:hypothetical protein
MDQEEGEERGSLFLLQMAEAGVEPSSCVWVEGKRADGLVSVCRQPERPQRWLKALSEVNWAGQWWSGVNARAGHCVSISAETLVSVIVRWQRQQTLCIRLSCS